MSVAENATAVSRPMPPWECVVPVRVKSEPNQRDGWGKRYSRQSKQKELVDLFCGPSWFRVPPPPWQVTITRHSPRFFDDDNLVAGCKAVRDQLAKRLGVNDGNRRMVSWAYGDSKEPVFIERVRLDDALVIRIETRSWEAMRRGSFASHPAGPARDLP